MDESVRVHCYVDQLINNDDGQYDCLGSAWFVVPSAWLLTQIVRAGFKDLKEFFNSYTYDNSEGLLQLATEEGVLMGCGAGSDGSK